MPASRSHGQASVELVALLPLLAVGAIAIIQLLLAAHAAWAASQAAQAAARADAIGLDARAAARSELPPHLERGLRLRSPSAGEVELRLAVPRLVGPLGPGHVAADARFEPQR